MHVHDIFFPHDYPAEWLLNRRLALNEQYLLEAFLSFNEHFAPAIGKLLALPRTSQRCRHASLA
jgi:hypothetical protein